MSENNYHAAGRREAPTFDASILEEIKARLPIATVIGQTTKLTKSGATTKGRCPFHAENSASFYVYAHHYHCFGCGEHGDVITFVQKTKGGSFVETIKELANLAGISLPQPTPGRSAANAQANRLKDVLRSAAEFFAAQLNAPAGRHGIAYLTSRSVTTDDIKKFRVGWAPPGGNTLVKHLRHNGYTDAEILGAGLARKSDPGPELRDFFFGRVIFPITNRHGDILSFGGRSLGENLPKYINGSETDLYKKSRTLYGLNQAAASIRKQQRANLVEGYLDVLAMHRIGVTNTVAPLGTGVTLEQIDILWDDARDVVICMDGDRAGVSATLKLCEKLLPKLTPWRRIHVTTIHAGEDPDSLIGKGEEGIAELRAALEQPQPIATFMFEAIRATHDVSSITGRAEFRAKIRETVMSVIDPDLAVEWEEASLEFITTSLTRKNAPHVEMLDEKVAEILIGSVLLDPVLLTKVEDIFAIMPVPQTLSGLKTDITRWWLTSELKTKEALIQYLRAGDALHAARSVALIAKAHQERSENAAQIARDPAKIWTSLFLSRTAQKNVENAPSVMRCQQGQPTITVSL